MITFYFLYKNCDGALKKSYSKFHIFFFFFGMIDIFLLFLYRYTTTVTQYGKYHLFPPFSSNGAGFAKCTTHLKEISPSSNQINANPSNGFGILLNFLSYPLASNVESQLNALLSSNKSSVFSLNKSFNYSDFSQTPIYPVVINSYNHTYRYKVTITCMHNSKGMDFRDNYRQYYLPCYFVLFLPMFIAAFRSIKKEKLRIVCILNCCLYFIYIFLRYLPILVSKQSTDVNKQYVNTYYFILASDLYSSCFRVFIWSILLMCCYRPVFVDKDFNIKNFSIVIFLLNCIFELINHIFFVNVFPYLEEETINAKYFSWLCSLKNIIFLYWCMYAIFPIEILLMIIKILNFLPNAKSKFIRRTVKGTMWLIFVCSFMLYISQKLAVYFAMINGGFSCFSNLLIDTTDFFFPSLVMGAVFHFEKSRQYYSKIVRNRREKKNNDNHNANEKKSSVNKEPLLENALNYTQMNEPLLLNSTTNSIDVNNDFA